VLGSGLYYSVYELQLGTSVGVYRFTNTDAGGSPIITARTKSRRNSRATATIVLPEFSDYRRGMFPRGTLVFLRLGQTSTGLRKAFYGYVRKVRWKDHRVELECDDSSWVMDGVLRESEYGTLQVATLIQDLVSFAQTSAPEFVGRAVDLRSGQMVAQGTVDGFSVSRVTCFQAMTALAREFGLDWYFTPGKPELNIHPPFAGGTYPVSPLLVMGHNITRASKFDEVSGGEYGRVLLFGIDESGGNRPIKAEAGSGSPVYHEELSGGLSQSELQARADMMLRSFQEMQIEGSMVTIGNAEIVHSKPIAVARKTDLGEIVKVGMFQVESVEHNYQNGAFTTAVSFADTV